jgi:5-methylcytosine-specific restriction endonuclease McrA
MPPFHSGLDSLLHVLTDKRNSLHRKAFAQASSVVIDEFYIEYPKNLKALGIAPADAEGELSLILTIRLLWRLVPMKVFTAIDPDYENMAKQLLLSEFSSTDDTSVRMLSSVFRRLRSAWRSGRPKTTLDLTRPSHYKLMTGQQGCCAACLFEFPQITQATIDEDDLSYFVRPHEAIPGEITLEKYYRKPVLDHIIPYFLGGDDEENWQILCHSCNSGKGEALSWINRKGWMPPARISDGMQLTGAMRYARLIGVDRPKHYEKNKQLRIRKANSNKLIYLDNLEVVYA